MKRTALALAALILLAATEAHAAAKPVPGNACDPSIPPNAFTWSSGAQTGGYANGMFCNTGNTYTGIINFQSTGNVGIGTTSPNFPLDVETNSSTYAIYGYNSSASGRGVLGEGDGTTGIGVLADAEGSGGTALYASTNAASNTGTAVHPYNNSATGWSIYADGNSPSYFKGKVGIGTTAPGALLDIGNAGSTLGTERLEGSTSGYVQLQPAAAAGSWTMTLPATAGTNNYVLKTDGTGVTSWVAQSGGSAAPAGSDQQVQLNNNGVLYASSGLAFNSTSGALTIGPGTILFPSKDSQSVAIGNSVLANIDTSGGAPNGLYNIGIGYHTLGANTTGTENVAIGSNDGLGNYTLAGNTTGSYNIAIGAASLATNTTGNSNTALGFSAETYNTSGGGNTFVGGYAGLYAGGSDDVGVGGAALENSTNGYNSALGASAGKNITTGINNIAIGQNTAAGTLTTGSGNILIGNAVDTPTGATSNYLNIGGIILGSTSAGGYVGFKKAMADTSKSVQTPTTGFSITVGNGVGTLILTPAGTLATGTVKMPSAPADGQIENIISTQTVTTLTLSPNAGQSINSAVATIGATSPVSYIYNNGTTTWYRMH